MQTTFTFTFTSNIQMRWMWTVLTAISTVILLATCQSPTSDSRTTSPGSGEFSTTYQTSTMMTSHSVNGYEPQDDDLYPVFIWITGTRLSPWSADDQEITRRMAERGFVAVSIDYSTRERYPRSCVQLQDTVKEIFDETDPSSAINQINARDKADITQGIVVSGFSQGGNIAALAKNYHPGVKAAFVIGHGFTSWGASCYSNDATVLPSNRIRSIMGATDTAWPAGGDPATNRAMLEITTGSTCGPSTLNCIQQAGNGWYLVQASETADHLDVHCFYYGTSLCGNLPLDAEFEAGDHHWSLNPSLDWLASFISP